MFFLHPQWSPVLSTHTTESSYYHHLLRVTRERSASTRFKSQFCRGLLPLLKISHSVAPKLHLSHSRVRLSEASNNSGATQGILSMITAQKKEYNLLYGSACFPNVGAYSHILTWPVKLSSLLVYLIYIYLKKNMMQFVFSTPSMIAATLSMNDEWCNASLRLTILSQNCQIDARVTELDEWRATRWWITLSGQQQIFCTDVTMSNVLLLLQSHHVDKKGGHYLFYSRQFHNPCRDA